MFDIFDILVENYVKVKKDLDLFFSQLVFVFLVCFVNFCFSKGNQNSIVSIIIEVVFVFEIKF